MGFKARCQVQDNRPTATDVNKVAWLEDCQPQRNWIRLTPHCQGIPNFPTSPWGHSCVGRMAVRAVDPEQIDAPFPEHQGQVSSPQPGCHAVGGSFGRRAGGGATGWTHLERIASMWVRGKQGFFGHSSSSRYPKLWEFQRRGDAFIPDNCTSYAPRRFVHLRLGTRRRGRWPEESREVQYRLLPLKPEFPHVR